MHIVVVPAGLRVPAGARRLGFAGGATEGVGFRTHALRRCDVRPIHPIKRFGGVTLGGKIVPIFFNTQEDSGSLPIEVDVSQMNMGDVIELRDRKSVV